VCDDYKPGSLSEKSMKKAEELLFSYARVIYSDKDLEQMKGEAQSNGKFFYLTTGDNHNRGQSMTQGIGSFFSNMFSGTDRNSGAVVKVSPRGLQNEDDEKSNLSF